MSSFRKLKIHGKFHARSTGYTQVPEIRLEGKWLEDLGFTQGDHVQIKQEQNKLTITIFKEHKAD